MKEYLKVLKSNLLAQFNHLLSFYGLQSTKTTNCYHFVCFLPKSWQKLKTSGQKMQKIIFEIRSAFTTITTTLQSKETDSKTCQ